MNTLDDESPCHFDALVTVFRQIESVFLLEKINRKNYLLGRLEEQPEDNIYSVLMRNELLSKYKDFLPFGWELEGEIKSKFLEYKESKLQDRYSNQLVVPLVKSMIPTYLKLDDAYNYETDSAIRDFLAGMVIRLFDCIDMIRFYIKLFTPELYNENKLVLESAQISLLGLKDLSTSFSEPNSYTQNTEELEPSFEKNPFKNLPPKVLLLEKLGFFKLPQVEKLSWESKGKLVSVLCGGNADNAVDYIRSCDPNRKSLSKNPYRNPENLRAVNELLNYLL